MESTREAKAIRLHFIGVPIAKQRHRTAGRRTYNPQNEIEAAIKFEARYQYKEEPLTDPLKLKLVATFPRPKGHFGTGRNQEKLKPSAPVHHVNTPDTDNITKFYKDALNGIAYLDDSQVVSNDCIKQYSDDRNYQGMVEITIETIS